MQPLQLKRISIFFSKRVFLQRSMSALMILTHRDGRHAVLIIPQRLNIHPETLCLPELVRLRYGSF